MSKSFPFESKNIGTPDLPEWDRAITAQDERDFNKLCWTNGVFPNPVNGLLVVSNGGMRVEINPGGAHLEGARFWENSPRQLTLSAASASLPRIDRVVLRFDTSENKRNIEIYLKEGVAATNPSPQDIIRQQNYYEIVLADIYIPSGAKEITNINIVDQRANPELCGFVLPAIPYEKQSQDLWLQLKEGVNLVRSALDETTAGNLQSQINNVDEKLSPIKSRISTVENIAGTTTKLRNNAFPKNFSIAQLTTYSLTALSGLGAHWSSESIRTMGTFDITGSNPKFIKYKRWNGLTCIDIILSGNVTINNAQGNAYYSEIKSVTLPSGFTIPDSSKYTIIPSGEFAHASDYATIKGVENGKTINFYIASGYKSPSNPYKVFLRVVYVTSAEDKCIRFWRKTNE